MTQKPIIRGMRDVRSMHSVVKRGGPTTETGAYADLHRLVTEKARLERELGMWLANVRRIEARLADIESEVKQIDEMTAREREKRDAAAEATEPYREMTLTY